MKRVEVWLDDEIVGDAPACVGELGFSTARGSSVVSVTLTLRRVRRPPGPT